MNTVLLFGMPGGAEIIIILLVIIMFFGADKIPEFARTFGKGMREIKNATNDIQREIRESTSPITDITDKVDIKKQVKDLITDSTEVEHASTTKDALKDEAQEEKNKVIKEDVVEDDKIKTVEKTVARKNPYEKSEPITPKEDNN